MKRVYKDKSVVPLVSSQEQKAPFVPRMHRLSTGYHPFVNWSLCSTIGLHKMLHVRASEKTFRRRFCVLDALEGTRDARLLGKMFCRRPVLPGAAPPPRRAPRPEVCPGFGLDRFVYMRIPLLVLPRRCSQQLFYDALGSKRDG